MIGLIPTRNPDIWWNPSYNEGIYSSVEGIVYPSDLIIRSEVTAPEWGSLWLWVGAIALGLILLSPGKKSGE